MLARAAENLYWMARYQERAENTARLINSTTHMLLDLPHGASFGWTTLIEIVGLDNLFHQLYPNANEESIMRFLIEDSRNPSSIYSCVRYARENTRTLREVLPAEMWERINSQYLYIRENASLACLSRRNRYIVLNNIIEQRHAIIGLVTGTMGHDTAYQILKLGRNLERADMTTRILDLNLAVRFPQDTVLHDILMERIWMSTLDSLSAYQAYRRLISMHVSGNDVINFLIGDTRFPRSFMHCLGEMENCLKLLPKSKQLQHLVVQLRQGITDQVDDFSPEALHEFLDELQAELAEIHDALTRHYFHACDDNAQSNSKSQSELDFDDGSDSPRRRPEE